LQDLSFLLGGNGTHGGPILTFRSVCFSAAIGGIAEILQRLQHAVSVSMLSYVWRNLPA
jgi:hypothetical protein